MVQATCSTDSACHSELVDNNQPVNGVNGHVSPSDHPRIEDLRQLLLKHAQDNPNDFQEKDVELIKTTRLWINRFLNCRGQTFEQAAKHAIGTFKWRKEFQVDNIDFSIIPMEGWMSGAMFVYKPDCDNLPVMYLRARMHFRVEPEFYKLLQHVIVYNFTQLDKIANREFGWATFLDLNGIGWANVDLEMLYFLITTMRNHFPNGCRRIIVYGLPWFLNILAKTVISALPSDTVAKIKFISGSTLPDPSAKEIITYSEDLNGNIRKVRPMAQDDVKPKKASKSAKAGKADKEGSESSDSKDSDTLSSSAESIENDADAHLSDAQIIKKLQNAGLYEFFKRDQLPDFLGGTHCINYRICPVNAVPAGQMLKEKFNLSEEQITKTLKPFQKILEQTQSIHEQFIKEDFAFRWSTVKDITSITYRYMNVDPEVKELLNQMPEDLFRK